MAGGRSAFTQEEDELLVKYIAKYNPQTAGRQGNKLYITLTENPRKWGWGKAHSWQSWRARYTKNQVEFDQKIKRYMRQKAAAALEKEFPSQPGTAEATPSKPRRETDAVDRRPIIDSSTLHAPSKDKGKQRAVDEDAGQGAGGLRLIQPVEAARQRRSEAELDDMHRVAPRPSRPSKDLVEEPQAPRQRPRIEDTNGHVAPSVPPKTRRKNDAVNRRPIIDASTLHAPSKDKGKQRAVDEDAGQGVGGWRLTTPVEAPQKRRSETDFDDMHRVAPKPSRPSKDLVEETPAPRQRPRIEDTNGHVARPISTTSTVQAPAEPISAPVDDTASAVASLEEDELLVRYIAKYNPQTAGRQGDRLYITLTENPRKWGWGRAHTWQSWRARYMKNQVEFDQKIERYLRQKAAAALEKEVPSRPGKADAVPPKTSRSSRDIAEESPAPHQRPRMEDTNGHVAPSTSKTSTVQDLTETVSAPVEDTESAVESLEDDVMQELFGSYVEEDEEDEVEELVPDSQADKEEYELDANIQSIYPALPISPIAPEPHVPGAFDAAVYQLPSPPSRPAPPAEPTQPPKKPKPKLRQPAREDPFGTPSEPPSPPRPRHGLARAGALPVLQDTGFRTTLKRPRRSSVGDEKEPPWPPKRAKTNARSKEVGEASVDHMVVDTVVLADMQHVPPNWPEHVHPPRRVVHVNAVASSSKTKLPSPEASDDQQQQPIYLHPSTKVTPVEIPKITVPQKAPVKAAVTEPTLPSTTAKPAAPIARTTSVHALPVGALSDNDPFTARAVSGKDKGKARADFAIKDKQPKRIDLHKQSLHRRLTSTSVALSANLSRATSRTTSSASASTSKRRTRRDRARTSTSTSASLRASLAGIGPADPQFELVVAAVEDITQTLARMAAAYGVVEQTAQAAYVKTKSLEKTRFVLQRLREAMLEKERAIYAAMPELAGSVSGGEDEDAEDEDEEDEEVPSGLVLRTDLVAKEAERRAQRKASTSPVRRSGGRPSLTIRPAPDEEDFAYSEYEPPSISHASRFARLMKQGRVSEAVEREKRRISGFSVPATQDWRQSSPPSATVSPTPKRHLRGAPMEIDNDEEEEPTASNAVNGAVAARAEEEEDNADDIYASEDDANRDADNESEHQDDAPQASSPPYPSINALIKRLSGGHHKAPEFLATAERHRELALGAEVGGGEELREFEATHSPSMLRLWSVKWAKEMLSGFSRVEETPENKADDA